MTRSHFPCTNCGAEPSATGAYLLPGCCARCGFLPPIDSGLHQVSNRCAGLIDNRSTSSRSGRDWRGDASYALAVPFSIM